jgi:N-dimethylarginine dimethylaminohydrolase
LRNKLKISTNNEYGALKSVLLGTAKNPETIVVDETQVSLIEQLKSEKFDVIALPMRQSRTLGGGFHCVTCDIERL